MSPLESESRIAAQLAPFTTVELMPYFLNRPRSCAITIGEQSVSAIMPKRRSGVSGALELAPLPPAAALGAVEAAAGAGSDLQPTSAAAAPMPAACMKSRRLKLRNAGAGRAGGALSLASWDGNCGSFLGCWLLMVSLYESFNQWITGWAAE